MFTTDETDRVVRTTDRVIGTTDRVMRTTDVRVVRTTDIENVKPTVSLWNAKYQEEAYEKQQQMMPNKGWEINEEDNDMIQLRKIILKQTARVPSQSFTWCSAGNFS